jgi:hypothetical protein
MFQARIRATVPKPACRHRTSNWHFTADRGRIGSLMIWADPGGRRWSAHVLGTEQNGFGIAAAARAAAVGRPGGSLSTACWR